MKRKQIWFLEDGGDGSIRIRSHLGKYLKIDGDGKFTGDGEENDSETALVIEPLDDGRWNLKSAKYGWYAGGSVSHQRAAAEQQWHARPTALASR